MKVLKYVNEHFEDLFGPNTYHRVQIPNSKMELVFNSKWDTWGEPFKLRFEWYPPQDRYCMLIDVDGSSEFIYHSLNLTRQSTGGNWNPNFLIEYNIEQSFFDCLPMAYPMTTNFKYKHVAVLKCISDKYAEKKKQHNIK